MQCVSVCVCLAVYSYLLVMLLKSIFFLGFLLFFINYIFRVILISCSVSYREKHEKYLIMDIFCQYKNIFCYFILK